MGEQLVQRHLLYLLVGIVDQHARATGPPLAQGRQPPGAGARAARYLRFFRKFVLPP